MADSTLKTMTPATGFGGADILYIEKDGTPNLERKSTKDVLFTSNVADGASAIAHILDSENSLVTAGAKLLSFKNAGVEKAFIDKDGQLRLDPAQSFGNATGIAFGDGGTRIYESSVNILKIDINDLPICDFRGGGLVANNAGGFFILNRDATDVIPIYAFQLDTDTGVGSAGADQLSQIAGGNEMLRNDGSGSIAINRFDAGDNAAGNVGSWTNIRSAIATITSSAAATLTATGLIPAGAFLLGLTARITTAFGTSTGLTDFDVGDGSDVDRWANSLGITAGTTMDVTDATAATQGSFATANDVVLTAVGGNFDATGVIELIAHYISLTAPTG